MNVRLLTQRLNQSASLQDPLDEHARIVAELKRGQVGFESVQPILVFMENNPEMDLGAPGPLVHFVERFFSAAYEAELVASIRRRPTGHTLWMANRVLNVTKTASARKAWMEELRSAASHPEADEQARDSALHFLDYASGR